MQFSQRLSANSSELNIHRPAKCGSSQPAWLRSSLGLPHQPIDSGAARRVCIRFMNPVFVICCAFITLAICQAMTRFKATAAASSRMASSSRKSSKLLPTFFLSAHRHLLFNSFSRSRARPSSGPGVVCCFLIKPCSSTRVRPSMAKRTRAIR